MGNYNWEVSVFTKHTYDISMNFLKTKGFALKCASMPIFSKTEFFVHLAYHHWSGKRIYLRITYIYNKISIMNYSAAECVYQLMVFSRWWILFSLGRPNPAFLSWVTWETSRVRLPMGASSLNRENIFQRVHVTSRAIDDMLGLPMKS